MIQHLAFDAAHKNFPEGGVCLEFGVYVGNSYIWFAEQILKKYPHDTLIGFDSWQGLPEETKGVFLPPHHKQGAYKTTKDAVLTRMKALLIDNDPRFKLVDGWLKHSLTPGLQRAIGPVIFVHVDLDIHSSTVECLTFVGPLLRRGTVLVFDDWKDPKSEGPWGECLAWYEFAADNPHIKWEITHTNGHEQKIIEILSVKEAQS